MCVYIYLSRSASPLLPLPSSVSGFKYRRERRRRQQQQQRSDQANEMAMELPLFLGDGPDAALFSSLWSSFPDDLQPPPQQEVPFISFSFCLANHLSLSLSRLLHVPPPHFPVLLLARWPAVLHGRDVSTSVRLRHGRRRPPCTAPRHCVSSSRLVTFTTSRYRGQAGLGRQAHTP